MDISKTRRNFSPSLFSHSLKASELPRLGRSRSKIILGEDAGLHPSLGVRVPRPAGRSSPDGSGRCRSRRRFASKSSGPWLLLEDRYRSSHPLHLPCGGKCPHSSTRQCRSRADPRARAQKPACRFRLYKLAARRSARVVQTIASKTPALPP